MQYLITAKDHTDAEAYERRMSARPAHMDYCKSLRAAGTMIIGAALMDEAREKMIGSAMIFDFNSPEEIETWKANEPYLTNNVWQSIEIKPCNVAPTFQDWLKS